MKKLICFLFCFCLYGNLLAGPSFELQCFNHTQNTWQYNMTGGGIATLLISANVGDSLTLLVAEEFPGYMGPWFLNGDTVPNSTPADKIHLIVTQSCSYTVRESEFWAPCNFVICVASSTPPSKPAPIGTPVWPKSPLKACPGETIAFTLIYQTPCATSYTWNLPVGATIIYGLGTPYIKVLFDSTFTGNDSISVIANNAYGSSPPRKAKIGWDSPKKPSEMTGQFNGVCGLTNVVFKVESGVFSFNSYNWTLPTGATFAGGSSNGNKTIKVNFPSTTFTDVMKVTYNNGCGVSAALTKKISSMPVMPALIAGPTVVCAGSSGNAYSIAPVPYALNYTWTGPAGSHISDGSTTSLNNVLTTISKAVVVNYGAISINSNLKVKANNACGNSNKQVLQLIPCGPRSGTIKKEDLHVELYPNPFSNTLTVTTFNNQLSELFIFDLTSRKVLQQQFIETVTINTNQFDDGIYIYQIHDNDGIISTGKIVKQ